MVEETLLVNQNNSTHHHLTPHPKLASGLRYDDLLIETDPDVVTAIARLPPRERALRTMRLKRALDCELKHSFVPEYLWNKQGPHRYLTPLIEQARKERLEADYL
mmetsp:Transcript_6274/g.8741  ORF Transcript_6274/g.8741 Transcript_6274/m.8741 type:complete len:105 (+) Transcript_6274:97-411(+)